MVQRQATTNEPESEEPGPEEPESVQSDDLSAHEDVESVGREPVVVEYTTVVSDECRFLPVIDHSVVRRMPATNANANPGPVRARVARRLRPPQETIRVGVPSGWCAPRFGTATMWEMEAPVFEVAQRIGDCPRHSSIAVYGCTPPNAVQYHRLQFRVVGIPFGTLTDIPWVRETASSLESIAAHVAGANGPRDWRAHLHRRYRAAEIELQNETLTFVETHWKISTHDCPIEGNHMQTYIQHAGEEAWLPMGGSPGVPIGVYHDDQHVIAVEVHGGSGGLDDGLGRLWSSWTLGLNDRTDLEAFTAHATVHYKIHGGNPVYQPSRGALLISNRMNCYYGGTPRIHGSLARNEEH